MKRKHKPTNNEFDLTVPSQTAKLKRVRRFVAAAAQRFGFSMDDASKIALAVDEACTNIIKHAYNFAEDKAIHLTILTRDGRFEVLITDHGKPFDPDAVKLPNMKEYLSHYRHGGLGMYLMKSLMDRVEYRIHPGLKNQVVLVKYLPQMH
jgi:serine/threonine-protein kinase RsbW